MSEPFHAPIRVRWSIKWKLILLMTVLIVCLMVILTYVQISSQQAVLQNELTKRIALMHENLIERGKTTAATLAQQVENELASFNFSGIHQTIADVAASQGELKYVIATDAAGVAYVHTLRPELLQSELTSDRDRLALQQKEISVFEYDEEDGGVVEIVTPIQFSTAPWGVLRLVFTLRQLEQEIRASQEQIHQETRRMIWRASLTSLGFIGVAVMSIVIVSTRFSRPLIYLTQAARSLSKGNFSISLSQGMVSQDEIGVLTASFVEMSRELKASYEQLEEYSRTLEHKVAERTQELHESLRHVEAANQKIMESIEYAKLIQHALLPSWEEFQARFPQSFLLWQPRDVVGGDMFFTEFVEDRCLLAVIDCTGHGVPGAFMTMIASSTLSRIARDEKCCNPAEALQRLNTVIKQVLHQNHASKLSDNGLDAAMCSIDFTARTMVFAGAKLALFKVNGSEIEMVKGDRQSIGYKRSPEQFAFTNHQIAYHRDTNFYIATDGYFDQIGLETGARFGTQRFKTLLEEQSRRSFDEQREAFIHAFETHRGQRGRLDDVTVIGFRIPD